MSPRRVRRGLPPDFTKWTPERLAAEESALSAVMTPDQLRRAADAEILASGALFNPAARLPILLRMISLIAPEDRTAEEWSLLASLDAQEVSAVVVPFQRRRA